MTQRSSLCCRERRRPPPPKMTATWRRNDGCHRSSCAQPRAIAAAESSLAKSALSGSISIATGVSRHGTMWPFCSIHTRDRQCWRCWDRCFGAALLVFCVMSCMAAWRQDNVHSWSVFLLMIHRTCNVTLSFKDVWGPGSVVLHYHFDGLVQERRNSIANALELCLSCTNPSILRMSRALVQKAITGFSIRSPKSRSSNTIYWIRKLWV